MTRSEREAKEMKAIRPASRLAFKFAWRVSVVIAALIGLVGISMSIRRKDEITKMIDGAGAKIVTSVAAHGLEYWRNRPASGPNPLLEMVQKDPDIINILIYVPDPETGGEQYVAQARASDFAKVKEQQGSRTHPEGRADITVSSGSFENDGGSSIAARLYRKSISGADRTEGTVLLVLSSERVERRKWAFLTGMVVAGLVAVGLGIGCSFLLAALVTRPIRSLASDMSVVSRGDLDHTTRVHGSNEIGMLGRSFNRMIGSLKEAQQREVERLSIERELSVAHEIQSLLLPTELPKLPNFEISRYYEAAKEVGGDYYDFIPVDGKHLGVVVADVSGKGIPGSMVMTMVRSILRYESRGITSAGETLKRVNRLVAADIKRGMFVTAIYLVIDISSGRLTMASAGHNPLVYWNDRERKVGLVKPGGMALGIDRGPEFDKGIEEVAMRLNPGDRIVAYTDGIVEAMNEADEEFTERRFYAACQRLASLPSEEFVSEVVAEVRSHQGTADQHDDITLATLRYLGEG